MAIRIRRLISVPLLLLYSQILAQPILAQKFGDFSTRPDRAPVSRTPSEQAFVFESFFDSNGTALGSHTGEVGASWTKHPDGQYSSGSVEIQDGRAHGKDGTVAFFASGLPSSPDYNVATTVVSVPALTSHSTGVTGRMDPVNNTFLTLRCNNNTSVTMIEVIGGTTTQIFVTFSLVLGAGGRVDLELKMVGDQVLGFVDGVQRITGTTTITGVGRAGIRYNGTQSSSSGYHIEEIRAYRSLNAFPTDANMAGVGFLDYDANYPFPPTELALLHDFRLAPTSPYKGYGLDGKDAGPTSPL